MLNRFFTLLLSHVLTFVFALPRDLAAEEQPHIGIVQVDQAAVRSGPGTNYYVTSELAKGARVEIYRMTDSGWCGIRPLEGSFSYVPVDAAQPHPENKSVLVNLVAGTKTRVGSQMTADLHVEYIALKAGERLKQVGTPVMMGNQRWYRVFPPSGEFRWVHLDDLKVERRSDDAESSLASRHVSTDASPLKTEKLARRPSMKTQPMETSTKSAASSNEQTSAEQSHDSPASAQWHAVASRPDHVEAQSSSKRELPQPTPLSANQKAAAQPLTTAELELELSQTVSQDVDQWRLLPLRRRIERLIDQAIDSATRQHAHRLLKRVEEFREIQQREHQSIAANRQPASAEQPARPAVNLASGTGPLPTNRHRFQSGGPLPVRIAAAATRPHPARKASVHGWLTPVESRDPKVPQFALTTREGELLYFISASPNVDLAAYQDQRVEILGTFASANHRFALVAQRVNLADQQF